MARDYAKKGSRRRNTRSGKKSVPGWLWLLVGLTVGLFIAFLVFLSQHEPQQRTAVADSASAAKEDAKKKPAKKEPSARDKANGRGRSSDSAAKRERAKSEQSTVKNAQGARTAKQSGTAKQQGQAKEGSRSKREAKEVAKKPIDYKFYEILPEFTVEVPEGKADKTKPMETPGTYILQVGSFRSSNEADSLKAELALLGIVSNVQAVAVDGKSWHRVRIGPYRELDRLNQIRRTLRENKIDFVTMEKRS
jgi:cell division protein FtsN